MAKPLSSPFSAIKKRPRRAIKIDRDSLVRMGSYREEQPLPYLIEPSHANLSPASWAASNRELIEAKLLEHGAILFRGFAIPSVEAFGAFAAAITPELLDYVERAAPRTQLDRGVYTSTEYPADQWIPLHHEMSYSHNWPTKLFFFCDTEPDQGGRTPFAEDRRVFHQIPAEVKEPFLRKKVMYVRNYGEGVDMPWQEVFQTTDRNAVEAYFRRTATEFEWLDQNRLRTRMIRQAVATHPRTGDTLWFNHAHMFHMSNMPEAVRGALLEEFSPEELPRNAFYGDGQPIETETLDIIRRMYVRASISFPWQKGDVLLLDNFLVSHGRAPYQGARKICVAMAELYTNPDFRDLEPSP